MLSAFCALSIGCLVVAAIEWRSSIPAAAPTPATHIVVPNNTVQPKTTPKSVAVEFCSQDEVAARFSVWATESNHLLAMKAGHDTAKALGSCDKSKLSKGLQLWLDEQRHAVFSKQ